MICETCQGRGQWADITQDDETQISECLDCGGKGIVTSDPDNFDVGEEEDDN